jgi:hypothetical protein
MSNTDIRELNQCRGLIPSEGYCDQPYVIVADDRYWLVTMTTGKGIEGEPSQHVITFRSPDQGKTWVDKADVEPADGPEASYSVLFKTPFGRIYCFYNHNTDKVKEVLREDGRICHRVDSLGHYVFKFSDDNGKTWSEKRYEVPVREFVCDRNNVYQGKLRFFWNVGRPITTRTGDAIFVLHKVGAMGTGFFAQSEGVFLKSPNILTERNPEKLIFETLPDGEIGLRAPSGGGRISEEHTIVELSDGSLYSHYRTIDGYPACSYSRDGGHKWSAPEYAKYAPDGRKIKHPRAATFVWKCRNGNYLLWYHNHGGAKFIADKPQWRPYAERNPVWISGGVEKDGFIHWSQPEILLYDKDFFTRISYPDLIEDDGRYYIAETQKSTARVHEIDIKLIEGLWQQFELPSAAIREALLLELKDVRKRVSVTLPPLSDLNPHKHVWDHLDAAIGGFSIELCFSIADVCAKEILLDNRENSREGFFLQFEDGILSLTLNDGRCESSWSCDRDAIRAGVAHHAVIIVDGFTKTMMFVIDGVLCDGGEERQFGWGRFHRDLLHVNAGKLSVNRPSSGSLSLVRIHERALRVSEAVGNCHAEFPNLR